MSRRHMSIHLIISYLLILVWVTIMQLTTLNYEGQFKAAVETMALVFTFITITVQFFVYIYLFTFVIYAFLGEKVNLNGSKVIYAYSLFASVLLSSLFNKQPNGIPIVISLAVFLISQICIYKYLSTQTKDRIKVYYAVIISCLIGVLYFLVQVFLI